MLSSGPPCAWKLPLQGAELFGPGIMFGDMFGDFWTEALSSLGRFCRGHGQGVGRIITSFSLLPLPILLC